MSNPALEAVNRKNEYAKSVCLFLSELLRTRQISLARAAEIAQKVVSNINLVDTEADFLKLIQELSRDFEELFRLEKRVMMHVESSKRDQLEAKVREFVIGLMMDDVRLASMLLQEAINDQTTLEELGTKFPQFKQFIESKQNANPKPGDTGNYPL